MEETGAPAGSGRQFILDIGTRSVVGIAGRREGELFVVDAWELAPHPRRAMIDGQIEDIDQVASVAATVKRRIEEKLGERFTKVSVAAAGRALKTSRGTFSQELTGVPITAQTAYGLENAAVNAARLQLDELEDTPYYCVGHSVVRYLLDGYPFRTALGHKATKAEVEVIATFLPAEVVESLHRCMELVELDIDTMTLEPIAAMRAVIPQDLRLLNLALVDIGAGTSDIAVSNDSTVAGYTMATVAGDEITESIIRQYLVDFATAEALKLALETGGPFTFTDILGFEHQLDEAEIMGTIQPAIDSLAGEISRKVLECNGGAAPAAAFLVGGGSKTPGLAAKVADGLGLPHNRVALAGTNFSGRVLNKDSGLDGPEFATPVGIALIAADNAEVETATVTINGAKVRLFMPDSTSIMDALLIGGYRYTDLMGRNGRSLTFTLNGVRTVLRGTPYTTAVVTLNGKPASLSAPVESGDSIEIEPAVSGEDADATIATYAPGEVSIRVTLNGTDLLAGLIARINGAVASPEAPIMDQDVVELFVIKTVGQLCDAARVPTDGVEITVNGVPADVDYALKDGDVVLCAPADGQPPEPVAQPAIIPQPVEPGPEPEPEAPAEEPAPILPDITDLAPPPAEPVSAPQPEPDPAPGPTGRSLAVTLNGKNVVLPPKPGAEPYRLFDMLALVDIDPQNPKGKIKVLVNGQEAPYLEQIVGGDKIEIGWEEE